MANTVTEFYIDVLKAIVEAGTVAISDSVLVVCGGPLDKKALAIAGFSDVTITNLDAGMASNRQDAENLTYADGAFDLVVVRAGLHHCRSPHRALLEMYRVARKCAVAFEARDSAMMRVAVKLGLTIDFELESITSTNTGGVVDTGVPNFIYRWTERDVTNAIVSFDPAYVPKIDFFYRLRLPIQRFTQTGNFAMRAVAMLLEPLSGLFTRLAPKQCNEFAFAITKTGILQPWMETGTLMSRSYVENKGRVYRPVTSEAAE
jgi:SAM-dependent methyltransferase